MLHRRPLIVTVLLIIIATTTTTAVGQAQPVYLKISTASGDSMLTYGEEIVLSLDANGYLVRSIVLPMNIIYSNTNTLGHITSDSNIFSTPKADSAFGTLSLNHPAYDPYPLYPRDSMCYLAHEYGGNSWFGSGKLFRITSLPKDTGTVRFDTTFIVHCGPIGVAVRNDTGGIEYPTVVWISPTIVINCPFMMGDCNEDGTINSADIIYYVNYLFKGGPDPVPMRTVGDVNCSGGLGSSDIIYLVNYLFKGGPKPCWCYRTII